MGFSNSFATPTVIVQRQVWLLSACLECVSSCRARRVFVFLWPSLAQPPAIRISPSPCPLAMKLTLLLATLVALAAAQTVRFARGDD